MRQKFVVRLLDAGGQLLAWTALEAAARPIEGRASCPFWPTAATHFVIDRDGEATSITVHWCDLDIARINALVEAVPVKQGQVFAFNWTEPVWLVSGMRDVALPPVTLRQPVSIGVPTGALAAAGSPMK